MEWRTIKQQKRRAGGKAGYQPIPHHPAAGREVEQPVARVQVGVQAVFFHMLDQAAAGAMDNAFRDAGRARGIENVKRMIERQPGELDVFCREVCNEFVEGDSVVQSFGCRFIRTDMLDNDRLRGGWQARADSGQLFGELKRLAGVPIAVAGKEEFWFNLAKAINHTLNAEVGGAGRKDRAD